MVGLMASLAAALMVMDSILGLAKAGILKVFDCREILIAREQSSTCNSIEAR
jgi:hypothetical protein